MSGELTMGLLAAGAALALVVWWAREVFLALVSKREQHLDCSCEEGCKPPEE